MKCPSCEKEKVKVVKKSSLQEIKGDQVEVISDAYECSACHFSFYDDEMMDDLAMQASDSYRKKNNLLTSSEIKDLREQFGMSQAQFAHFLSIGSASIKRWEGIGIQDRAMDQLMRLKCKIEESPSVAAEIEEKTKASVKNGKRSFSNEKYRALYLKSLNEAQSPLFANKLMFYCDFLHYKDHGVGITGAFYQRLEYGPVPYNAHHRLDEMIRDGLVEKGKTKHNYKVLEDPNMSLFGEDELDTIEKVLKVLKGKYQKLPDISHMEDGWLETPMLQLISYEYADKLKIKF